MVMCHQMINVHHKFVEGNGTWEKGRGWILGAIHTNQAKLSVLRSGVRQARGPSCSSHLRAASQLHVNVKIAAGILRQGLLAPA